MKYESVCLQNICKDIQQTVMSGYFMEMTGGNYWVDSKSNRHECLSPELDFAN
jgi:hypothetical protein